jgi:carbon monoxide dehydrogenase subunit G
MDMNGERYLPAPRLDVWQALHDPEILRASIPGCRSLTRIGENAYAASVAFTIGRLSADFTGQVTLQDPQPPSRYRIEGGGDSAAGSARGGADVALAEQGEGTLLTYAVKADLDGDLAQLAVGLVEASAGHMAMQFFDNFTAALAARHAAVADAPLSLLTPKPEAANLLHMLSADVLGFPAFAWAVAAIYLFIAYNLFGGYL